jgi:hypothetical protein
MLTTLFFLCIKKHVEIAQSLAKNLFFFSIQRIAFRGGGCKKNVRAYVIDVVLYENALCQF